MAEVMNQWTMQFAARAKSPQPLDEDVVHAGQRRHVRGQAAFWPLHRHGVGRGKYLFPSGVRSAWRHRDQARSRSRYAADHRLQGDHARSGGYAQLRGRAFCPRGGGMAVSRLGLPRAAAAAEQLRTRGVDHAARQSEFSWVRRFPAHGVGPCRPGARRSMPRLLFSRCRARTLLFRSCLCDLSLSCRGLTLREWHEDHAEVDLEADSPVEGTGFEPSVPLLRKALLGVANRRRPHERRSHLQVQVRNGNACLEWLPTAFPFAEGRRVRIRLPPEEALDLIEQAVRRNLVLLVDHTFLYTPAVRKIRQLIGDGVLGDI